RCDASWPITGRRLAATDQPGRACDHGLSREACVSASDIVLEISGLSASYGSAQVLNGLNLKVRRNRIATIVGSNGAGKTTVMKAIAGLIRPIGGSVRFDGRELAAEPCDSVV